MANHRHRKSGAGWAAPQIGVFAGIPVKLHFTFILFLIWIAMTSADSGGIISVVFVLSVFFCIVLHEFGHALVAKHFDIQTRDIVVYPVGGLATIIGRRPNAKEEFWIAIAGPIVNFAIAACMAVAHYATRHSFPNFHLGFTQNNFIDGLFSINIILPLFNLIPAFPMDGGRIFRSLLAMRMPEERATQIAATVGQVLAVVLGIVGIVTMKAFLMLVAFFVFLGAGQELSSVTSLSLLGVATVRQAMMTKFQTISSGATMHEASAMLLEGTQQDFPVVNGDEVLGILYRDDIVRGIALEGDGTYVAGTIDRSFSTVNPDTKLTDSLEPFSDGVTTTLVVMENDKLVGILTKDNVFEFMMLEHARKRHHPTN